jgi:hypothetical protein
MTLGGKRMHRLKIADHVMLLIMIASSASGGTMCPGAPHHFPVPASEMVQVVADWLAVQGMVLHNDYPRPGYIHLMAQNHNEKWDITIRPRSALSSVAEVIYEGGTFAQNRCRQLQQHIHRYLYGETAPPDMEAEFGAQLVPAAVLDTSTRLSAYAPGPNGGWSNLPDSSSTRRD